MTRNNAIALARWIEEDAPSWWTDEHSAALYAYYDAIGGPEDYAIESFEEAYAGRWDSERAFGDQLADDLDVVPREGPGRMYFDYDAWTRDLFLGDYFMADGYVFRSL